MGRKEVTLKAVVYSCEPPLRNYTEAHRSRLTELMTDSLILPTAIHNQKTWDFVLTDD